MNRLRAEDGVALVPALSITIIVLLLGSALLSTVDVQSNQSAADREQEGSFQLAESALNTQTLQLSRTWPATTASAYPACNQSVAASGTCSGTTLAANYTASAGGSGPNGGSDFAAAPTWSTRVLDDVNGGDYYTDALLTQSPAPCPCDANGNGAVWVRSEATVAGQRSVLVTLVKQGEPRLEALPTAAIIAGWFETTNNGRKTIVDAKGASASAGKVAVRCSTPAPAKSDLCLGYDPRKGQLNPADAYQTGYVDGTGTPNETNRVSLDGEAMARLKLRAQSLGTYYATGCPPTLTGELVYVENANCSYTSNSQFNSAANPGVVIFASGTLSLGGTTNYYGLIYMAMGQGTAPASGPCTTSYRYPAVTLGGNAQIYGAILIDKCGGVVAGSSGVNIVFDANVFNGVLSDGVAAGVKNSYRILPTS